MRAARMWTLFLALSVCLPFASQAKEAAGYKGIPWGTGCAEAVKRMEAKGFVFNHMNLFVGYVQPATEELQTDDLHPHVVFTSATGKLDGCVGEDGTIYELQPYQDRKGELHLCNQGYVSLAEDLFLIGAAIWLLIGDTFVTLSTSASIL